MPSTKRRLWQLHLSTAIVLMLVAGGLLYLNITPFKLPDDGWNPGPGPGTIWVYGWPFTMIETYELVRLRVDFPPAWNTLHVLLNSATAIMLLLFTAFVLEFQQQGRSDCCGKD